MDGLYKDPLPDWAREPRELENQESKRTKRAREPREQENQVEQEGQVEQEDQVERENQESPPSFILNSL